MACAPAARAPQSKATATLSVEQTTFPTREMVAKIAATPAPARLADDNAKDVPAWELTGALPDAMERRPPQDDSPWGKLFMEATAARGEEVLATEAMHCVARENAAFYLANDALPAEMLERFIAARCGAPTWFGGTAFQVITGDPRTSDDKLFAQFGERVKAMIDKALRGGRLEAGLAYVRKGGRAVIGLAMVPQTVRLERTPIVPGPDGKVVIKGELLGTAVGLRALVNRGRYGYAECTASPGVPLPRFVITCETAREDEVAWLSVTALPPGRVLGAPVIETLVWPSGSPGKTYAKLARGSGDTAGASPEALAQEINKVRAEAKLPPVRLADAESKTATQLAPHYFASIEGRGDDVADQVALGLLAGWEVDGLVRNGRFVSTWVQNAGSWSEVIRAALSRPMGRQTLLDPAVERVAIGPVVAGQAHGALFSTYALFDAYRHDDDAKTVAARIGEARAARGLVAPKMIVEMNAEADRAAQSVQSGKRTPEEALNDLMERVSGRLGRNVRGWAAETTSLEHMKWPDELSAMPSLTLGIGVAHHRRNGHAWGRFLVYVVILDEGGSGGMTARRGEPSQG
ncbi:Hypothetical protein A7982_04493 [Minicystis rosea]|nr:Hypothetical protein A7982_04493 [Minicystis rosea]